MKKAKRIRDCAHIGSHHSKDAFVIYHGSDEPARACGFHAAYFMTDVIDAQTYRVLS